MTVKSLREVQFVDQVAWGTSVAPTVFFPGVRSVSMPPSIVNEIVTDVGRGTQGPGRNTVKLRHESRGVSLTGQMVYEFLPHILDGADEATPAGIGPYTYLYTGPTTGVAVPHWQTLTAGAGDGVWQLNSAVMESITLTWAWGEMVEMTANFLGYAVQDDALAVIVEPDMAAATAATGCHVTVSVDAFGGAYGTTPMTKCLSGSVTLSLNRDYLPYVGSCFPAGTYDKNAWIVTGDLSLQQDATSAAFVDAIVLASTRKKINILMTNGGAAAALRSLDMDIFAEVMVNELHTDADDLVTSDISFTSVQDEDDTDFYFAATVTNNTATIY